jgi:hypothetical protein
MPIVAPRGRLFLTISNLFSQTAATNTSCGKVAIFARDRRRENTKLTKKLKIYSKMSKCLKDRFARLNGLERKSD